jgi:ATP-dependent RNA helicase DHX29
MLQVARRHMLSQQALDAMLELRRQFATLLQEAHLLPQLTPQQQQQYGKSNRSSNSSSSSSSKWGCWADDAAHPANRFAGRPEVLKAALVAALVPHVAVMMASGAESRPGWLDGRGQQVRHWCIF